MKIVLLDFFNLIKRYTYRVETEFSDLTDGEVISSLTSYILNRIDNILNEVKPQLLYICSDCGFNTRAASVVDGYKANRNKQKSLTDEEKEKSYIEYLKKVIGTLPFPFLEVNNTEADMLIGFVINYLSILDDKSKFVIVSSDSDFLQFLSDKTSIYDWNKGLVTVDNWIEKYDKHGINISISDYALAKSIVGDKSDNIIGVPGIGWKTVSKLFNILYDNSLNIDRNNIDNIINYIDKLLVDNIIEDKKIIEFLYKTRCKLVENKDRIHNNMKVIDITLMETPFAYKIMSAIRRTFNTIPIFNKTDFMTLLKINRYNDGNNSEEYYKIKGKYLKSSMIFRYYAKVIRNSIISLKHMEESR